MKFITYTSKFTDQQTFVSIDETGKLTLKQNEFVFMGFRNGIHPYHRKRIDWIVEVLQSKGIVLNIAEVATVDQMGDDVDSGNMLVKDMFIPKGCDKKSVDGNIYILFQDTEMGRGWAYLISNEEILAEDHRDNILDDLEEGDFIRSFGIDYKKERVNDLDILTKSMYN